MKIKLTGNYKSLASFESDELGDFTVITGKNGSGKTHFYELVNNGFYDQNNQQSEEFKVEILSTKVRPRQFPLEFTNSKTFSGDNWKTSIDNYWNEINRFPHEVQLLFDLLIKNNLEKKDLKVDLIIQLLSDLPNGYEIISAINNGIPFGSERRKEENIGIKNFIAAYEHNEEKIQIMKSVSKFRQKPIHDLKKSDYLLTPVPVLLLSNRSIFSNVIGNLFYKYAYQREVNIYNHFRRKEYGEKNGSISDEEFVEKNPPPWELMNNLFQDHNIEFQFDGIDKRDFHHDDRISFELINQRIKKAITHDNLSSGEKIIIGLLTKVFLSEYLAEKKIYPGLLVFDEPDAHLHPEMVSLLIEVFQKTFIDKLGFKIIITTHSPSTVALAPEDSIYEMKNGAKTSLKKINKDQALNILTGSLPTLSIDYKNHKQVFVEGESDRYYYQMMFDKLHQKKGYLFRLYFISYGKGKSSCSQVKKTVYDIRKAGNESCFGIIDWDKTNKSKGAIMVHGDKRRYTIENYLFDPVYFFILFRKRDNMHNINYELNCGEHYNSYDLKDEPEERLQEIWDWFINQLYSRLEDFAPEETNKVSIEYASGQTVKVPEWHIMGRGHSLEKYYTEAFPTFTKGKFKNAGRLNKELTKIAARAYPLISLDTQEVFEKIMTFKS